MLSEQRQSIFVDIISEATEMVFTHVDRNDLTGVVDYASIYAQSPEEFSEIAAELQQNGSVVIERPSGNYYMLNEPLETPAGVIRHCRVRLFDTDHPERGYADFEVTNYSAFKEKYSSKPYFSVLNSDKEMIELRDPAYNVRAYFTNRSF